MIVFNFLPPQNSSPRSAWGAGSFEYNYLDSDFDDDLSDITDSDFDGDLSEITNSFTAVEMPDE